MCLVLGVSLLPGKSCSKTIWDCQPNCNYCITADSSVYHQDAGWHVLSLGLYILSWLGEAERCKIGVCSTVQHCRHGWDSCWLSAWPKLLWWGQAALGLKVTLRCFLTKPLFMHHLHSSFGPEPKYIGWSGPFSLCGVGCFVLIK